MKKKNERLIYNPSTMGAVALFCLAVVAPATAAAPESRPQNGNPLPAALSAILDAAAKSEGRIRSGRVELFKVTENNPPTMSELPKGPIDPAVRRRYQEWARLGPSRTTARETLFFDNQADRLLEVETRDQGQISLSRALFTQSMFKTVTRLRHAFPDGTQEEAFIYPSQWPPYSPYDRWMGRNWSGRIAAIRDGTIIPRLLANDPVSRQTVLLLTGGPGAELDAKLWIDRRRADVISRLQAFDKKTGRLEVDEQAVFRSYGTGLWYPQRLVTTYYRYDPAGRRHLAMRETSVVRSCRLNIPLPAAAFTLEPARGAFVQDSRVQPPLVWTQGITPPRQAQRGQEPKPEPSLIGRPAPELDLPSLSGRRVRLSDWRGKVVLLNLFAYW